MTASDQKLDHWLRALKWSLAAVPQAERDEIVQEAAAHIADRLDAGAPLEDVLAGFGAPEAYARRFLDEMEVTRALADQKSAPLLGVVMRRVHRSLVSVLALAGLLALGLASMMAVAAAWMKLTDPRHAGLWWNDRGTFFLGTIDDPSSAAELLGLWLYPAAVAVLVVCWIVGRLILLAAVRTYARR